VRGSEEGEREEDSEIFQFLSVAFTAELRTSSQFRRKVWGDRGTAGYRTRPQTWSERSQRRERGRTAVRTASARTHANHSPIGRRWRCPQRAGSCPIQREESHPSRHSDECPASLICSPAPSFARSDAVTSPDRSLGHSGSRSRRQEEHLPRQEKFPSRPTGFARWSPGEWWMRDVVHGV
jgi:hypothetical protein